MSNSELVTIVGGPAGGVVVTDTALEAAIGSTANTAVTDPTIVTSAATLIALTKGLMTGLGAVADAAWTSGSGSEIALLKAIAGAAISTNPVQVYNSDTYVNLTNSALVKTGAGTFSRITVNAAGTTITVTFYDNTAASGTKIASVLLTAGASLTFGCAFATGLYASFSGTTGTPDITVMYR